MSLADMMDNLEVVNSDDVAAANAAQSAVDQTAQSVQKSVQASDTTPSKLPADVIDSAILDNAMQVVKEVQGTQSIVQPDETEANSEEIFEDVSEEVSQDKTKQISPYQKRVQGLVARAKAAEEELSKVRAQASQQMERVQLDLQRQQAEFQRQQAEFQREQLELLRRREDMAHEATLSPEERARKKFLADVATEAEQRLAPKLKTQEEVISRLMAERQQLQQAAQAKARLDRLAADTKKVINEAILSDYDKADAEAVSEDFDEMYMTWCAATGVHPTQGVSQFKQLLGRIAKAEMKAISKRAGAKVQQSQNAPRLAQTVKQGVSAGPVKFPPWADLRANGYSSYVEWQKKGMPALTKRAG